MERHEFRRLVDRAVKEMPSEFRRHLETVQLVIEDEPSEELLESLGFDPVEDTLLGFYDGIPLTERDGGMADTSGKPFDVVYVFQFPLEDMCETVEELEEEVRKTIVHEVAHHFGMDEDQVDRLGYG